MVAVFISAKEYLDKARRTSHLASIRHLRLRDVKRYVASPSPEMGCARNFVGRSWLVRSSKMARSVVLWGEMFTKRKKRLVATSSAHSFCVIPRRVFD